MTIVVSFFLYALYEQYQKIFLTLIFNSSGKKIIMTETRFRKKRTTLLLSLAVSAMLVSLLTACGDEDQEVPIVGFISPQGLEKGSDGFTRFYAKPVSDQKGYSFTGSIGESCSAPEEQCAAVYFYGLVGFSRYEGFVAKELHNSPSDFTLYAYHVIGNSEWTIKVIKDGKSGTAVTTTPFSSGPTEASRVSETINQTEYETVTYSATFNDIDLFDESNSVVYQISSGDSIEGQYYPTNFLP